MNLFDFYIPEWFFIAANLIILTLVLKKFFWKPIIGVLDARQEIVAKTERDAEEAERLRAEAESERSRLDAELDSRAAELMKEARGKAGREYDRIVAEAEGKAEMIISAAGNKAAREHERMLLDAQKDIAAAVLDIAGSLIHANMDEEKNRVYIDEMLKDALA
jgi:F-type H+-transporting ATPase subunit b